MLNDFLILPQQKYNQLCRSSSIPSHHETHGQQKHKHKVERILHLKKPQLKPLKVSIRNNRKEAD